MRDQWTHIVSERLAGLELPDDERDEVIEEVAAHLRECAGDIESTGVSDVTDRTLAQVSDWPKLASQIRRAKELRMSATGVDLSYGRSSTKSHRRLLASVLTVTVLGGAAAGFVTSLLQPVRYRSQAVIQVTPPQASNGVAPVAGTALVGRISAMTQTILSRTRLESMITEFNLYSTELVSQTTEEVVEVFRHDISMRVQAADSFAVSYTGADPTIVMKVTERLAALFTQPDSARSPAAMEIQQIGQQFKLTEPAQLPDHPIDSVRARYVGFGAAAGLLVGVLVTLGMMIRRYWSSKRPLTQTA